jgi:putative transposase
MERKRHTAAEISAKLHQADELVREGKLQGEIAHTLGISVMTYHRWRKLQHLLSDLHTTRHAPDSADQDSLKRLHEVQLENSRLRHIVTDLLLEKVRLEEELSTLPGRNLIKQAR